MKRMILSVVGLALTAMIASACANTGSQNQTEVSAGGTKKSSEWRSSYFPMHVGDHFIYEYDMAGKKSIRVKNVVSTPRGLRLDDADGECYYFESDANGWRIHGETKLGEADHTHYFQPAMTYASHELFEKKKLTGVHYVIDDGKRSESPIRSEATFIGYEDVTLPRLGKQRAIHTTFAYMPNASSRFQIHNWLVDGLGTVKRTLRMTRGDQEIFSVKVTMIAARVNGKIFPAGDEGFFAKTIFDQARSHRKTVDKNFKGLSANVKVSDTSGKAISGTATVSKRGKVEFEAAEGSNAKLVELTQATLSSRYGHRARLSGEATPATTKFELLKNSRNDSVGVRNLSDTSMGSNYEVIGSRIRVVRRDMGPQLLHLQTEDVFWSRKKYLPSTYWWEMRDKSGKASTRTTAHDVYKNVGGYLLPTTMKLTTNNVTTTIELIDVVPVK